MALPNIDWGSLYVASEWAIRLSALVIVPQRRTPAAARAWLLAIFFLPWVGVVLYLLFGRAFLPARRLKLQAKVYAAICRIEPRALSGDQIAGAAVSPELLPALRLAERMSEFTVVGGNTFALLPVYDTAIASIIAEVDRAQLFVHMLFYIFEDDATGRLVANALTRAVQRGVRVRVLMDAIGSRGGLHGLAPGLRAAGAEVIEVMPLRLWGPNAARLDLRNHRKIVVVDGLVAFFGSQNIVDANANHGLVNEEMLVRSTGPIVRELHAVLLGDRYLEVQNVPPEVDDRPDTRPAPTTAALAQVVASGPGYCPGTVEAVIVALLYGARNRVVLTAPYVIPSETFLAAMCHAARRGVHVLLIVDAMSNKPLVQLAQESYYGEMLGSGVEIWRHTTSFLHAKHVTVDDEVALIGSANLDLRSFALNAEVAVLIYDRQVVAELREVQTADLHRARRVTLESRARVSRGRRLLGNLARLTDSVL